MKFLVVGLGSMGKRRVRNLRAIGGHEIAGFDANPERMEEAKSKYKINVYKTFEEALTNYKPDAFVISTSPDLHMTYAYQAEELGLDAFIEASVVDSEKILNLSKKIENKDQVIVPSCTMRFFPAPVKIKELVKEGIIGSPLTFTYHSGQYLPDWHPWEKIEDFYVSNRSTGGCREIVPFELTWLNDIFGEPSELACVKKKLTDINADIDDIYYSTLEYPDNVIGNIVVDVLARPKAIREFRLFGTEGEIYFSSDTNELKYINIGMSDWKVIKFDKGQIENQYINPENPYIEEMRSFVRACLEKDRSKFPNQLMDDYKVLNNLYNLEKLSGNTAGLSC